MKKLVPVRAVTGDTTIFSESKPIGLARITDICRDQNTLNGVLKEIRGSSLAIINSKHLNPQHLTELQCMGNTFRLFSHLHYGTTGEEFAIVAMQKVTADKVDLQVREVSHHAHNDLFSKQPIHEGLPVEANKSQVSPQGSHGLPPAPAQGESIEQFLLSQLSQTNEALAAMEKTVMHQNSLFSKQLEELTAHSLKVHTKLLQHEEMLEQHDALFEKSLDGKAFYMFPNLQVQYNPEQPIVCPHCGMRQHLIAKEYLNVRHFDHEQEHVCDFGCGRNFYTIGQASDPVKSILEFVFVSQFPTTFRSA